MRIYTHCVLIVFCIFLLMYGVAVNDILDYDDLHIGTSRYAEILRIPTTDIMPLNTLVNVGYILVGLYWCRKAKDSSAQGILKSSDLYFFFLFNNLACMYGTVSIIRMVTQKSQWATIDRWLTLLFFALVPLWSSHIRSRSECKSWISVIVMTASFFSYPLILKSTFVYENAVACHIMLAIYGGIRACKCYSSRDSLRYFFYALCSCSVFVTCNVLDSKLASISIVFHYVSGHFISRIFDAGQIFFVNSFFYYLTLEKIASKREQKKKVIGLKKKKKN